MSCSPRAKGRTSGPVWDLPRCPSVQSVAGSSQYIKITYSTSTLTQYIIVREGDAMATYITAEPSVGEVRFIARLNKDVLSYEYPFGNAPTTPNGGLYR